MADVNDIWNSGKGKLPDDKLMAYLEGKLSPEEQREVEAWLDQDSMESDAIEGLKELPTQDSAHIANSLNSRLDNKLKGKAGRRRRKMMNNQWSWLAIFIILLLCMLGYVVLHYIVSK
jgi:anti-sigma factor RsiW